MYYQNINYEDYFAKSHITRKVLDYYEINLNMNDFKFLLKYMPYKVILVGGCNRYKHIKIYNMLEIKNKILLMKNINVR